MLSHSLFNLGVDDRTWLHHLSTDDDSRWLGEAIGDDELADIDRDATLDPAASRWRISAASARRYTARA
jgi:hypothetical protein